MNGKVVLRLLALFFFASAAGAAKQPPSLKDSAAEPVKYVGTEQTDKRFYDGALRHAVGVHRYQAFRANRTNPSEPGRIGWTYNHQPYLAYWNKQFYLQYLSDLKQEHDPPGRTLLMTSKDGRDWSNPQVVFPKYVLPEIKRDDVYVPAGTFSVMHQRMGFYVAPNGRLLTLAFYSYCPTPKHSPNNGKGLGRVVREIYKDNSYGPIYFIRYNRHAGWDESNTRYPFYKESKDKGFVQACEALLADKLMTLQWWEEDRAEDGFYAIKPKRPFQAKALSYCHRPDGVVLAVWKRQRSALSADEGRSWTEPVRSETLWTTGAKTWVQKTEDGRYALVYDHSATQRNRFPLTVMTSDDCHEFDNLLCLTGEVPPQRYQGFHKDLGVQYVRGIMEGNGDPPGKHIWNTYSVNKEDIWVSRTRVPIMGTVDKHVNETFDNAASEADLELWNLHIPKWGAISIVSDPKKSDNKCLLLRDEEPHDYVLAERIFPESRKVTVDFRVLMRQVGHGVLCFEAHDSHGRRPMRLRFFSNWLWVDRGRVEQHPVPISTGKWLDIRLELDCDSQSYDLAVNGDWVKRKVPFWEKEKVETLQRLVFRTGPWRGYVPPLTVDREPAPGMHQEDLAGSDHKTPLSVYLLDDVKTKGPIKHVIVYKEPGRFCGWPANYGTWSWGNEILVGFKFGYYQAKDRGHSLNREKPAEYVMARSLDGGQTWSLERPKGLSLKEESVACPGGVNFTHPDFALRCRSGSFGYSYDRGKTWSGPYKLPEFGQKNIMARTDYIVNGKDDCLIFLTSSKTNGKEGRPFCARMTDAGKTVNFASWISPEPEGFSIMPSTVRISEKRLISAIRRKEEGLGFIEVYQSDDDGKNWDFLSKPATTGRRNGNPPGMVRLDDGRTVVTYGYRSKPQGIRARISRDNAKTWGDEIHLRDDGRTWDLGYPQTVLRPDGKLVTLYYYTTEENPEQHIAATIWDPDKVE